MQLPWNMNIKTNDIVLEIGPGAFPHYRSDVYIDKFDPNEDVTIEQFGGKIPKINKKRHLYITKNGIFPFKKKAFDYSICSHVLEHVPKSEIGILMAEIENVAKRGYFEFPSVFFESIYNYEVHLNILDFYDGKIYLLDKEDTNLSQMKSFTNLMIKSRKLWKGFEKINRSLMSIGFEWNEKVPDIIITPEEKFLEIIDKKYFKKHEKIEAYDYNWFEKKMFRIKEKFYKHKKIDIKSLEK